MQLSYPVGAYRACVERALCELLIGHQYASELPTLDRFTKFLTRIKESGFDANNPIPGLTTTELCKKGLPINWAFIQFNRGPLMIVEEDEFRGELVRCFTDESMTMFDMDDFGFGKAELNFWLVANNGSALEAAEALFYMRLYKLKSIDYFYLGYPFHSRIIHDMLQSFEPLGIHEYGTGFTTTWRVELYVPILRREVEGFTVQEVCTEVFPADVSICPPIYCPRPLDEEEWPESLRDEAREIGAEKTIITHDRDQDGNVTQFEIDGGCPDGTEPPDSLG